MYNAITPISNENSTSKEPALRALVLAAGEGSRLRPLTLDRPKPMLPIGDAPLLEHTVRWLRSYGVSEIAINLHYRGDVIVSHFGTGDQFGVSIHYSPEERLVGTAGAVRKLDWYFEAGALVIYGDLLTNVDLHRLLAFHRANRLVSDGPAITMSLYEPPNPRDCGIVELGANGRVLRMQEKPKDEVLFSTLSFSGVMILDRGIIDLIPRDTFYDFGFHVLPNAIQQGLPVYGLPINGVEYVIDIGTPERYRQTCDQWSGNPGTLTSRETLC
jgi:mannose-1-phosphate guanylyltransferase